MEHPVFDTPDEMRRAARKMQKELLSALPRVGTFDASRCPGTTATYFLLSGLNPEDTMLHVLNQVANCICLPVEKLLLIDVECLRDTETSEKELAKTVGEYGYTVDHNSAVKVKNDDAFDVNRCSVFYVLLRDTPTNVAKRLRKSND